MRKGYMISYDTVTPESAEDGDVAEYGWYDNGGFYDADDPPDPTWLDPPDDDDDESYVSQMLSVMSDVGVTEPSSSRFNRGMWYSTEGEMETDGTSTRYAVHLKGQWDEDEERAIFNAVTRRYRRNAPKRRRR